MILTTVRGAALTSVDAALALLLDGLQPLLPTSEPLGTALGAIAAEMEPAPLPVPGLDEARVDGFAFRSLDLVGASAYAPLVPSGPLRFVEAGAPMPAGCDCILDPDCVETTGPFPQVLAEALPGEGVRARGDDIAAGYAVIEAGRPVRAADLLRARRAGFFELAVRRPRVAVIDFGTASAGLAADFVADSARLDGAAVERGEADPPIAAAVAAATGDLVIVVGGTGRGPRDTVAAELAAGGMLLAHGITLEPGRLTAIGRFGAVPVVALPGAPDEALGAYWSIVRPVLDRLTARKVRSGIVRPLARKITSDVGVSQIVLLGESDGAWLPLATGILPLARFGDAVAWMRVAANSEGHAEGTLVEGFSIA